MGQPIYSANYVRIRLGHAVENVTTDCDSSRKEFVWAYESPKFIMEQVLASHSPLVRLLHEKWPRVCLTRGCELILVFIGNDVKADSIQAFKLPRPVLCIGGVLEVELLGRVQTQQIDQLYYIWNLRFQVFTVCCIFSIFGDFFGVGINRLG